MGGGDGNAVGCVGMAAVAGIGADGAVVTVAVGTVVVSGGVEAPTDGLDTGGGIVSRYGCIGCIACVACIKVLLCCHQIPSGVAENRVYT